MAGPAPQRRSSVSLERRLHRRAQPGRGAARARRGALEGLPLQGGRRRVRGRPRGGLGDELGRARRPRPLRRGWARLQEGDVRTAIDLLNTARALAEGSVFSDVDRAEIVFRLVARYKLASTSTAVALLDEALSLAQSSDLPCDGLRSDIYHWRSRCHRRQRDFEAAREDVEHALELAQGVDDRRKMADAYFQASLVAERTGHWVLSRNYAERAKNLFQELDDERTVGRLLNNLGGLSLLLGKPHEAIEQLKASFAVAVEADSQADAGQAVNGLATVHLRLGEWDAAEENAREALRLLDGREDFLDEIGQAQIVLGRSLLERDRFDDAEQAFRAADATFEQLSSISHRAGAWVALGDSPRGAVRTSKQLGCTGTRPKPCRTCGSKRKEEANEGSPAVLRPDGVVLFASWGAAPAVSSAGRTEARPTGPG